MMRLLPSYRVQEGAARAADVTQHLGPQERMHALMCVATLIMAEVDPAMRDHLAKMMLDGVREGVAIASGVQRLVGPPAGHG